MLQVSMKRIGLIASVMIIILVSNGVLALGLPDKENCSIAASQTCSTDKRDDNNDPPAQTGSITGTVSGDDGWAVLPLPFALVQAGGGFAYTNLFGNYAIDNLPLGTYAVTASKPGWTSQTQTVTLSEGSPIATCSFILQKSGGGGSIPIEWDITYASSENIAYDY